MLKQEHGISMIVLLFLVGFSLSFIMNQGLIANAKMKKDAYYSSQQEEESELDQTYNSLYYGE